MGTGRGERRRDGRPHNPRPARRRGDWFDVTIKDGKVDEYRVRLGISFKYEGGD